MSITHGSGCGCVGLISQTHEVSIEKSNTIQEWMDVNTIEAQIFRATYGEWQAVANVSIASAQGKIPKEGVLKKADVDKILSALVKVRPWPSPALKKLIDEGIDKIYRLSARAILRRAMSIPGYNGKTMVYKADNRMLIEPSLNVADASAIKQIKQSQVFWLKNHYDVDTLGAIRQAGLEELNGKTGLEASEYVKEFAEKAFGVGAFSKFGSAYFQSVAVNAATTARVNSSILEMAKIGVTRYEIMNPMDERTSQICRYMNGKVLEVRDAVQMVSDLSSATSPEDIKSIHPWLGDAAFKAISATFNLVGNLITNSSAVRAAGLSLPPYHGACRSTVDISEDTEYIPQEGFSVEAILSQALAAAS